MSDSDEPSDVGSDLNDTAIPVVDYASRKRRILMMLLAYAGLLGVISIFMPEDDGMLGFVVGLPILVLTVVWCHVDADQHDHVIGKFMLFSLVLILLLAFPIYIFQTRGLTGLKTLALAGLFVTAMAACLFATAFVTLYIRTLAGVIE